MAMDELNGLVIQQYVIHDLIGQGGMGDVYRGVDTTTERSVAIKVLKAEAIAEQPAHLARFIREGDLLRQLNHPNIVKVLATIEQDGLHYIVMEYVGGGSLRDLLDEQPRLPVKRALAIALELSDALTRAHHLNIVHRDLKPTNVLLAEDGTPRLTDFGIAHLAGTAHVTQEGALIGTPHYLSPEAINQQELDGRADIWAFGVVLFEMLTGQHPFVGDTLTGLVIAILQQATPDLEELRPDTPVALVDLVYRMLEKDRNSRMPSVRLVGAELEAILHGTATGSHVVKTESIPGSDAASRFGTPTPPVKGTTKHNLPMEATPFVGRNDEMAELARLFADDAVRLITILGPGGTGKTRLALEAAAAQLDKFTHGVYFVPLASLCVQCPDDDLVATVADVVGCQFREEDRPGSLRPGNNHERQLLDYLSQRSILLVMDNFEHLLSAAGLVTRILQAAPGVRVLTTSRERLNLQEETLIRIKGMDFPDEGISENVLDYSAVKLFIQSAQRVRPGFALTTDETYAARMGRLMQSTQHDPSGVTFAADELTYVARICRQVRGMPLGILLAAAWVEMLSPEEISREIDQNLDFLETEMRNIPDRHRSIRAVFETSWGQLSEAEHTLFMQLSIFRGGFTREAAQRVTGTGLRVLMSLVNKSLVERTPDGRYEIHNLLRQYAAERFDSSPGARDQMRDRHCGYYTELLYQQTIPIRKGNHQTALIEIENLRTAWGWAIETGNIAAIKKSLPGLAALYDTQTWYQEAKTTMDRAVEVLRMTRPRGEQGITYGQALAFQGATYNQLNMPKEGSALMQQSMAILRRLRARRELAQVQMIAVTSGVFQDIVEERKALKESIEVFRELDMQLDLAQTLGILGMSYYRQNEIHEAQVSFEEAYRVFARNSARIGMAWTQSMLGLVIAAAGDYEKARSYFQESLAMWQTLGRPSGIGGVFTSWGIAAWTHGDYSEAKDMLEEALAVFRESGNVWHTANGLNNLGHPTVELGQYDEALSYYREALELTRGQDIEIFPAVFLEAIIGIANITGKSAIAGGQEQAVAWLTMVCDHPLLTPEIRTIAVRYLADLKAKLRPEDYTAAMERGKRQELEDVIAKLLAEV